MPSRPVSSVKPRVPRAGRASAIVAAILIIVIGFPVLINVLGGFERTGGGETAVVRNGGPFDNNRIRQVIDPASSRTWIGLASKAHKYPAQQRFYTITSDAQRGERRSGVDVVTVPSSDGVNMGIEGTLYFTLNLDHESLKQFDNKFGTRKFRGLDGTTRYAWEGDDGWSGFLDQIIRPVIDNDLRTQINSFRCAELVSSCALVQNSSNPQQVVQGQQPKAQSNNANIAKVQNAINTSLAQDLQQTLGGNFIIDIHFNLVRITLPENVQHAVDEAQAAFAQVTQAQARVAQARAEAQANKARQDGYNKCHTCADIEKLKALPQGITVYAPGNSGGVALPTK
jgi:regulator of protease activity HflC (stomatin/prohibitin superfamily)